MYKLNDYVVFGNHGVCVIKEIGGLDISNTLKEKVYYTLEPLFGRKSKIYTPVKNDKSLIRKVIEKEEVLELLTEIPLLEDIWIDDDKKRDQKFREIMKTNDCRGWLRVLKTLNKRRKMRLEEGKKIAANDELYLKLAKDFLYWEFAAALEIEVDEAEQRICDRLEVNSQ